jgi:toxin ParE1/3/4
LRLHWNSKAREDRLRFIAYIREKNPQAALDNDRHIADHAKKLVSTKVSYKNGRIAGTHELIVSKRYVLVYQVKREVVEILRVLHTSLATPANLDDLMK